MPQAVTGTAEAMFEAVEENADGRISSAEYRQLIEAWNGRETDTSEVFTLLDLNHDGHLSRSESSVPSPSVPAANNRRSGPAGIVGADRRE
jgi:EF hand